MFSSLSRRRVVLLFVLPCLILIGLDRRGNPVIDKARHVFAKVMHPFDTAAHAMAAPIARAWYGMRHYEQVKRENQELRDQIDHQRGDDVEAQAAIYEYQQLLALNGLSSVASYPHVFGRVIGDAPDNFQNTVEISVGSNQGVKVGMPVTNGAGLVGKITAVYPNHSVVRLITDPQYFVSAEVLDSSSPAPPPQTTVNTTPSGKPVGGLTSTSTSTTTTTTVASAPDTTGGPPDTSGTTVSVTTTTSLQVVRETGKLSGQGADKPLLLDNVDPHALQYIHVGATVDTAGGASSLAPVGIPIGRISRITFQTGTSTPIVEVTPNAQLSQLYFVTVVLFTPGSLGS